MRNTILLAGVIAVTSGPTMPAASAPRTKAQAASLTDCKPAARSQACRKAAFKRAVVELPLS